MRVLAERGLGGATIAAVAEEAGVAPGLIHHHFENREDLSCALVDRLFERFAARRGSDANVDPQAQLTAVLDAALSLEGKPDLVAARAWVGLFAEAIRSKTVAELVARRLRRELERITKTLEATGMTRPHAKQNAAGLLSLGLGSLVFGALLPGTARGFAAPFAHRTLRSLIKKR